MNRVESLARALVAVDRRQARAVLADASRGPRALAAAEGLVVPALESIGADWDRGRVALAQVYMAGVICEELLDGLRAPTVEPRPGDPRIAIAVLEDRHMLGKRLVSAVLRASGYRVADLGRQEAAGLVERCRAERPDVLLISTLMLPSALRVRDVVAGLRELPDRPRVIVGGAPFRLDPDLAAEVGADGSGRTASDALELVRRLAAPAEGRA